MAEQKSSIDNTPTASTPAGVSPDKTNENNGNKEQNENFRQRKRMRVPTSCSVCRKRKIKCDKLKPVCSSCTKSNVSHLCHYEEPSWISSEDLLKHAKPVGAVNARTPAAESTSGTGDSPTSVDLPPSVQIKIESLKDKIKQLEASIAVTELSRSTPPVFSGVYGGGGGGGGSQMPGPIQLPQPQNSFNGSSQTPQSSQPPPPPPPAQYSNQHPQPFFNSQPLPSASFQPSSSVLASVPPISELSKYENDLSEKVLFFDYQPFIIKKRRLESHGPSSFLSVMRKDIYMKILWIHIWKSLEKAKEKSSAGQPKDANKNSEACCFDSQADVLSTTDGKFSLTYKELKKEKMAQKVQSLNSIGSKTIDQIILEVLPSRKVIMILCFRFFKFVYPFLPFLDESTFFFEIDGIIGTLGFKDVHVEQVNFQNKYDYSIMGLLLIVLKLAYLSISDKEFEEKEELKELKDFKFNPNLITAVHLCLDQYKYWRKPFSLRLMQLLLYVKCYYRYCNEDDDVTDGSENQILLGTLFSTGYALGLHRDPDQLASLASSTKKRTHAQLWRRMWHKLLELDANQSMTLGLPLRIIDDRSFDTKLPYDEGHEDDTDSYINKDFRFIDEKNQLFRDVYNTIGNIRNPPSVLDLMHLSRKLENFAHFKIGSLKEILNDQTLPNFARIKKTCYLFEVTSVSLNLNNNLFQHFEKNRNIKRAFKYLEENLSMSLKIINTAMNLAFNEELYVGKGFAFYFRANATTGIIRGFFALAAIALRVSQAKKLMKDTDLQRHELFKNFLDILFFNMENTLQLLTKMSECHYNFSRSVTALRLIYYEIKDPNFDFDKAGFDLLNSSLQSHNLTHNHLQDITLDDIPRSNFLLDLLDSEILRLMEISKSSLVAVLQPAIRKDPTQGNTNQPPYNPSGTGRGQFYDPIDGFTKRSSVSTDSSSFNLSPSAINQNNIFNIDTDDLNKLLKPLSDEDAQRLTNNYYNDPNVLSSEEYASLFGVFDDYGAGAEPSNLRNM